MEKIGYSILKKLCSTSISEMNHFGMPKTVNNPLLRITNSDYFKMPDYNTGNNESQMINSVSNNMFLSSPPPKEELPKTELAPLKSFEAEPTTYTLEQATNKMRELIKDLKEHGVEITADEMDFDTSYQIIIKIDKK